MDRDLVLAKLETLDRCLARIADAHGAAGTALRQIDRQDITVLNLQRAVQAMIDLAAHAVASEGLGLPDSLGASFTLLERAGRNSWPRSSSRSSRHSWRPPRERISI